ncbi:MAG: hypothetical protein WA823_07380 [Candidatus Acidiferrales bacterium]
MRPERIAMVMIVLLALWSGTARGAESPSRVVDRMIESKDFAGNKVGTSASRKLAIYLPLGYDEANAENLKSLRAFKFDWSRSDTNQDHVCSHQAYTHKLNEFGIVHEAEE